MNYQAGQDWIAYQRQLAQAQAEKDARFAWRFAWTLAGLTLGGKVIELGIGLIWGF